MTAITADSSRDFQTTITSDDRLSFIIDVIKEKNVNSSRDFQTTITSDDHLTYIIVNK